jgi:hypothetical protein
MAMFYCHVKKNLAFQLPESCFDAAATVILSKRSASKEAVAALLSMTGFRAKHKNIYLKRY